MRAIELESRGSFQKTEKFLRAMSKKDIYANLERYGAEGAAALAANTPTDSGITAQAWTYKVFRKGTLWSVVWYNHHVVSGVPVVILLQYGHGTRTGGFVQGRDFINPVIRPLFERISEDVWKAVKNA